MIELLMLAVLVSLIFLVVVIFGFIIRLWKSNATFKEISSDSWFDFSGSILKRLLIISILGLLIYLIAFPIPTSFSALCARVLDKAKGFAYLVGLLLVSALITMFEFAACLGIIEGIVGSPNKKESSKCRNPENSTASQHPVNAVPDNAPAIVSSPDKKAVSKRRNPKNSTASQQLNNVVPDNNSAIEEIIKPKPIVAQVIVQEKKQYEDIATVNSKNSKNSIVESKAASIVADNGVVEKERDFQRKPINNVKLDNPETTQTVEQPCEDFKKRINSVLYSNAKNTPYKKRESEPVSFSDVDQMNGVQFEKFCAELLKSNGFRDVRITPETGDQGVDITAKKGDDRYAIQCKHWKSNVGNSAIQEIYAGKLYYDCNIGVVMTNSHFTNGAKELANKTQTILWDRENLHYFMDYAVRHPAKS